MLFKRITIFSSGGHIVKRIGTIFDICVEDFQIIISAMFDLKSKGVNEEMSFKEINI